MRSGFVARRREGNENMFRYRLSLIRKRGTVSCGEFKTIANAFVEAFSECYTLPTSVEVSFYRALPEHSTRFDGLEEMRRRRERNEALIFEKVESVAAISEDSFLAAAYVNLRVEPVEKSEELASAFGSIRTGIGRPELVSLYAQPPEVFGDTVWSAMRALSVTMRKYRLGDGYEKDGTTFASDFRALASMDFPSLDRHGFFGGTLRGRMLGNLLDSRMKRRKRS